MSAPSHPPHRPSPWNDPRLVFPDAEAWAALDQTARDAVVEKIPAGHRSITLIERGDTVTENAIMAAARTPGVTTLRNASGNYMVQDLCFYLQQLGVKIDGVGSTTLTVTGLASSTLPLTVRGWPETS